MSTAQDDEELRLRKLHQYDVLDTPKEDAFERITRLVTAVLGVPIAAVTLVDGGRQWFKSQQGLNVSETPRDQSFCAHAMLGSGPMVVRDATLDQRFSSNPLVVGDPDIRFYVGIPLRASDGTPLGALCGIDTKPRDIGERELEILGDLADLTMEQLELRLLATRDSLTGAMRRGHFITSATRDMAMARRMGVPLSCLMIDADKFKHINDDWGHAVGDDVLIHLVSAISGELRSSDSLGRMGGEEFCAFLPNTNLHGAMQVAERVRGAIEAMRIETPGGCVQVTASIGAAELTGLDATPEEMIKRADIALYQAKHTGRNRVAA
ncbi:sensor domain-containing diguanylate cyclase [Devosia sp.]|uniref:sensor domain-containing diguanylate cyclase n=1 Tax=Devosia sp. TaxID=1871048 RepID=UPI003BAB2E69